VKQGLLYFFIGWGQTCSKAVLSFIVGWGKTCNKIGWFIFIDWWRMCKLIGWGKPSRKARHFIISSVLISIPINDFKFLIKIPLLSTLMLGILPISISENAFDVNLFRCCYVIRYRCVTLSSTNQDHTSTWECSLQLYTCINRSNKGKRQKINILKWHRNTSIKCEKITTFLLFKQGKIHDESAYSPVVLFFVFFIWTSKIMFSKRCLDIYNCIFFRR